VPDKGDLHLSQSDQNVRQVARSLYSCGLKYAEIIDLKVNRRLATLAAASRELKTFDESDGPSRENHAHPFVGRTDRAGLSQLMQ
jgi:hypothetical protein